MIFWKRVTKYELSCCTIFLEKSSDFFSLLILLTKNGSSMATNLSSLLHLECVVDSDCTDGVCTNDFVCVGKYTA